MPEWDQGLLLESVSLTSLNDMGVGLSMPQLFYWTVMNQDFNEDRELIRELDFSELASQPKHVESKPTSNP